MSVGYKLPRGTRAALNAKASAGTLVVGQAYLITDESRMAVAMTVNAYQDYAKSTEAAVKGVAFSISQTVANQVVAAPPSPYAFSFVAAGCTFKAGVTATASTVYTLKLNGTAVGSVTWSAGASLGVVSLTTPPVAVSVDDVLTLVGPATVDATLATISGRVTGN